MARGVVIGLALIATSVACASSRRAPTQPRTGAIGEGDDPGWALVAHVPPEASPIDAEGAPSPLVLEAARQLRLARITRYRHRTTIDEALGVFEYDCSGFLAYALRNAAPDALLAIPVGPKGRPRAEDFTAALAPPDPPAPWKSVARAIDARPGDVVAWLRPADVEGTNTGHVAIVWQTPSRAAPSEESARVLAAIGGEAEVLVRVVDSTETPHADDVRAESGVTGLGIGTIGLVVDESGRAIGYRWRGGLSKKAHATTIAIARVVR